MRAVFAGVLIGLVVGGAALAPSSRAQPAPDLVRAKDLYVAAETAMTEGRYTDAIRDYGATFDLMRDPVLFYKIAAAHEKAGKCDVALIYYGRYVKEARPSEAYLEMTRERVRACGGDERLVVGTRPADPGPGPGPGSADGAAAGSADAGSGAAAGSATVTGTATVAGTGSGSARSTAMSGLDRGAWLLVATSIAFVTIGSVLAYSANSAESDVTDLYVGFTGTPASFDDRTRATYDDLVAEGRRYEKLSWLSFGLAGATGLSAVVLFKASRDERSVQVTPALSPGGAGVRATLRW